jgi:hypothetical protein
MNSNRALLVLAAASCFALSSFAQDGGVGVGIALAGANSNSSSGAISGSKSSSNQRQSESQGQIQAQSNRNNSSGNTTTYTSTSTYREVRQVPTAYAPDALPTAPCFKPITGGGSSPFFGISFGAGKIDKGCDARETARSFYAMHNYTAAAKILCSTDAAKRAHLTMEDCSDYEESVAAPAPPPVVVNVAPAVAAPAPPAAAPAPAPTSSVPPAETKKISE